MPKKKFVSNCENIYTIFRIIGICRKIVVMFFAHRKLNDMTDKFTGYK